MWKLKRSSAIEPVRATKHSTGYDLYAAEDTWIPPFWLGKVTHVQTGIVWEAPKDGAYACQIASRSGLALRCGLIVVGGVIDSDYSGEIGVLMHSFSWTGHAVKKGDRIAQAIVYPIYQEESDGEVPSKERGEGGFGSTGI